MKYGDVAGHYTHVKSRQDLTKVSVPRPTRRRAPHKQTHKKLGDLLHTLE